jgi:PPOX class probable F420-dependent enzyme
VSGPVLTPQARELLHGPNFAVIATINADGTPQQSVVWVTEREGDVVFSTVEGRAKHRNLVRDPRIGVLVLDDADGYRYSEIRGTARLDSANADALIGELCRKYTGQAWVETDPRPRVNVIVTPAHQHDYAD